MANVVMELMATLGLDSKPFEDGLKGAENTAKGGGSKIGSALGKGMKVVGTAVAAAGAAVTAFAGSSVKAGMSFDTAMSQVAATMGTTVEDMTKEVGHADTAYGEFSGNLRDFAQFLGANTAFSATQAAEALNYMALAGYKTQESMDMLPSVLSLAAAGNFDLARASDMVTDAQTAFGMDAQRTAQMVDEMAKAASTGNTSVEQLGDAFLVVGGLAQELNGGLVTLADGTQQPVDGIQELEIALTAMANAGVKGSEAGTHMRNMLLKLSSPTSDGAMQFEKLGVSVFDAEGNMRSLQDVFGDLSTSLGELTQEEKIQAISDLFNVRDMASAEALLNAVGQDWDKIGASILDAQGAAAQMAATQLDNLAGDVTLFKSALEGAKIAISDQLTPSLRDFVKYGTSAVSELGTAFRERGLEGALETLGPVIDRGISLLFEKLPSILQAAVALLDAFVTAIITNLPKLIPAAVQLVQSLVQNIVTNLPQLLDAAIEVIEALADGLIQMLPELIPAIVQIVVTIVEKLTEPDTLFQLVGAALQIIIALANGLIEALPQLIEAIPQIIENLTAAILANLPAIIAAGIQIVISLQVGIIKMIPQLIELAPKLLLAVANGIYQSLGKIVEVGKQLVEGFKQGISDAWHGLVDGVKNLIAGLLNGIKESISSITDQMRQLKDSIKTTFDGIKTTVTTAWDSIKTAVSNKVDALVNKIKSKFDFAKEVIKRAVDRFKSLMNFHWSLPKLKLPHIKISGHFSIKPPSAPHFSVEWYRKAYDNPYLFTQPTVFGNKGFGDGNGGEIVYGHENLMRDIAEAMRGAVSDLIANIPPINITNVTELDGAVLARKTYSYNQSEIKRHGDSLVKA